MTAVIGIWEVGPLPIIHGEWHRNHKVYVSPADGYTIAAVTVLGVTRTFRFRIAMDDYRTVGIAAVRNRVDAILAEIDPIWLEIPAWEDRPRPDVAHEAD